METVNSLPVKTTNGPVQKKKPLAPLISLNSFVLGFLIGCVVIYCVGFRPSDVCIGTKCGKPNIPSLDRVKLDVPLPQNTKANNEHENRRERHRKRWNSTIEGNDLPYPQCPDRPLHIVVLVLASPNGVMRRNAIRGSWMHDYNSKNLKVTSKFLLGVLDLGKEKKQSLSQEAGQYGDLLLFENLKDSYHNLSLKVLHGLAWVDRELPHFDLVIKTDDDSFVRIDEVTKAYTEMGCPENIYWGYFNGHGFPEPTGKWAEQNWHSCPHYLPYTMGGGYILPHKVVRTLIQLSDRLILYSNEDVTVGSWLAPFNLIRLHDLRFNVESLTHGCLNRYIVTHKDSTRDMHEKYKHLRANGSMCSPEKEIRPGYVYDWTTTPLDCCNRTKGLDMYQSVYNGRVLSNLPNLKANYSQIF